MSKKYEQLKAKIIEDNSSILDLEFGCEVELIYVELQSRNNKSDKLYWTSREYDKSRKEKITDDLKPSPANGKNILKEDELYYKIIEILGRPIRLDDCLNLFSSAGKKTYLAVYWKNGYLNNQDESLIQWCLSNMDDKFKK